jgi:hypothetical protein
MRVELIEFSGRWYWVSKDSNDAAGTEFNTKEEAIADINKKIKEPYIINKEPPKEKKYYD